MADKPNFIPSPEDEGLAVPHGNYRSRERENSSDSGRSNNNNNNNNTTTATGHTTVVPTRNNSNLVNRNTKRTYNTPYFIARNNNNNNGPLRPRHARKARNSADSSRVQSSSVLDEIEKDDDETGASPLGRNVRGHRHRHRTGSSSHHHRKATPKSSDDISILMNSMNTSQPSSSSFGVSPVSHSTSPTTNNNNAVKEEPEPLPYVRSFEYSLPQAAHFFANSKTSNPTGTPPPAYLRGNSEVLSTGISPVPSYTPQFGTTAAPYAGHNELQQFHQEYLTVQRHPSASAAGSEGGTAENPYSLAVSADSEHMDQAECDAAAYLAVARQTDTPSSGHSQHTQSPSQHQAQPQHYQNPNSQLLHPTPVYQHFAGGKLNKLEGRAAPSVPEKSYEAVVDLKGEAEEGETEAILRPPVKNTTLLQPAQGPASHDTHHSNATSQEEGSRPQSFTNSLPSDTFNMSSRKRKTITDFTTNVFTDSFVDNYGSFFRSNNNNGNSNNNNNSNLRKSMTYGSIGALKNDPAAASVMLQQNRTALIAELQRRKDKLKKQLAQLQKEATDHNIFALVRSSNTSQLAILLREGLTNVDERDYNGCTALHVAASEGNVAIVRILLYYGANAVAADKDGRTPLDCAAANRHGGVARYLLNVIKNKRTSSVGGAMTTSPAAAGRPVGNSPHLSSEEASLVSSVPGKGTTSQPSTAATAPFSSLGKRPTLLSPHSEKQKDTNSLPSNVSSGTPRDKAVSRPLLMPEKLTKAEVEGTPKSTYAGSDTASPRPVALRVAQLPPSSLELTPGGSMSSPYAYDPHHSAHFGTSSSQGNISRTPNGSHPLMESAGQSGSASAVQPLGSSTKGNLGKSMSLDATVFLDDYKRLALMCTQDARENVAMHEENAQHNNTTVNASGMTPLENNSVTEPLPNDSILKREEDAFLDAAMPDIDLQQMHYSSYTTIYDTVPLIVCMCGLPGRGKSFIGKRLVRYLNWKGVPCRIFNAGNYRRKLLGAEGTAGADFFDPNNAKAKEAREQMAVLACEDLVSFISSHTLSVGILDATNTTKSRRQFLKQFFDAETKKRNTPYRILFIESVCTDETIILENILRSKFDNDDFKHVNDANVVISEFKERIEQYEKVYETISPAEKIPFIKIINVKHHVVIHGVSSGLGSRIAFFLLNLHPVAYPIYIALPGETTADRQHTYGGDEHLTPEGERYARALKDFIQERYVPNMVVLHATNPCVISTLKPLMDGDTEAAKSTPRFLSPTDPGHEHRIPTTEKPVMRLHHSKQDIAEIAAMAGGDVSYITTFQEEEKKHEKKVSSSSSSDFFASSESSVSSDEEDEEGAEEVLCPVPGLDDINYGRFSGHSIQWIKRRYARLSPLLYGEDCVNNSSTTTGTETTDDPPTVIPPPRTEKLKEAVKWLQHHPTDKDLRLSYCVQFPNGESCRQVNVRLEPAMMAVMRTQSPVFVVAPHVPAQGMLAFFADVIPELSPTLRVPYGCVVEIGIKEDVTIHPLIPVRHDFLPEVGSPLIDMEEVEEALGEIKRVNGAEEQKEAK